MGSDETRGWESNTCHPDGGRREARSALDDEAMRGVPVVFGGQQSLFGILHAPVTPGRAVRAVVFVNGWGGYRVGVHRMFVKAARAFAENGWLCLRWDFSGRGDSAGAVAGATTDSMVTETTEAVGFVRRTWGARDVLLVGSCHGGNVALAAARAIRVNGVVVWGAGPLDVSTSASVAKAWGMVLAGALKVCRVSELRRLIAGEVNVRRVWSHLVSAGTACVTRDVRCGIVCFSPVNLKPWPATSVLFVTGETDEQSERAIDYFKMSAAAAGRGLDVEIVAGSGHGFYSTSSERDVIARTLLWSKYVCHSEPEPGNCRCAEYGAMSRSVRRVLRHGPGHVGESSCFFPSHAPELFGVWTYPCEPATTGTRGCIVWCHPLLEEKKKVHPLVVEVARSLATRGYCSLRFDLYGCGDSAGDSESADLARWMDDIDCAVASALESTGSRVVLSGIRMGATLAAEYAARNKIRSCRLILLNPLTDSRRYVRETSLSARIRSEVFSAPVAASTETVVDLGGISVGRKLHAELSALKLSPGNGSGVRDCRCLIVSARQSRLDEGRSRVLASDYRKAGWQADYLTLDQDLEWDGWNVPRYEPVSQAIYEWLGRNP